MVARRLNLLLILCLISVPFLVQAQNISISSVSAKKGFFGKIIEISGSGFSSTPASLEVWFGAAQAPIVSSTENLIITRVPPGATTSAVTVLHKTKGLSATSSTVFYSEFIRGVLSPDLSTMEIKSYPNATELFDLVIVDLDKDGNNDIVASISDNAATRIKIYHNVTTGTSIDFTEQEFAIGAPSAKLAFGDINGDGKQDIAVARGGLTRSEFFVLKNNSVAGSIAFSAPLNYSLRTTQYASGIKIRDLDLDGKPEVVLLNTIDNEISIYKNKSTISAINLETTPARIPFSATSTDPGGGLVIDDFNNDGKQDLALTQYYEQDVYVLANNSYPGTFSFGTPLKIDIGGSLDNLVAGDINDDGKTDLAVTDALSNLWIIQNSTSTSTISFDAPISYATSGVSSGIAMADIFGNGQLDIMVTGSGGYFTLYENKSSGGTLTLAGHSVPQALNTINVASGDLSDDGKSDIALTAKNATTFSLVTIRNTICTSPVIFGETAPTICNGQTYTFRTTPALHADIIWKQDGTPVQTGADPFYVASTPGNYTVTFTTNDGLCSEESLPITLGSSTDAFPNEPTASNDGPTCIGSSVQLSAATVTGATYQWTGPDGFSSTDQNPVLTDITAAMAGTYTVTAFIDPCTSDPSTTIVEVINPPAMSIASSVTDSFCEGENVTLTVGAATGYTYQWSKDGAEIAGETNNTLVTSTAGSYTVTLTSTNCLLTSDPYILTSFLPPSPVFSADGNLCTGNVITFSESPSAVTGKTPTYSWDVNGDGTEDYNTASPSHTYTAAADYTVTLTMGYVGHTCTGSTSNIISIDTSTPFTITVTGTMPFCEGDSVLLEVPSADFSTASWSTGESGLSIYAKTAGTITVEATNANGCISPGQIDVTTTPGPTVTASSDATSIEEGQSVQLQGSGADTYVWSPGVTLSDSTIANPLASPITTTLYIVTGTDAASGCSGTAEVNIEVKTSNIVDVVAPVMFSPNNDGVDDVWVIERIENYPDCTLMIFARNGKIVYEATGYNNNWDGKDANLADLHEGAYFYTISCPDGKNTSGSVSIIR
ncbi:MAG: FG-GAP-like repeat-containing protein [Bacteroidota bacterium]